MNPSDRIIIEDLADSIQSIFNVAKSDNLIKKLLEIRQNANNDKKRIRKRQVTKKEILDNRTIPETFFELEIELFGDDIMYS